MHSSCASARIVPRPRRGQWLRRHGLQGSAAPSTRASAAPACRTSSGSEDPHRLTVGVPTAPARCIGPVSFVTTRSQRERTAARSTRSVRPPRSTAPSAAAATSLVSPRGHPDAVGQQRPGGGSEALRGPAPGGRVGAGEEPDQRAGAREVRPPRMDPVGRRYEEGRSRRRRGLLPQEEPKRIAPVTAGQLRGLDRVAQQEAAPVRPRAPELAHAPPPEEPRRRERGAHHHAPPVPATPQLRDGAREARGAAVERQHSPGDAGHLQHRDEWAHHHQVRAVLEDRRQRQDDVAEVVRRPDDLLRRRGAHPRS
jgi:hypothetical protein